MERIWVKRGRSGLLEPFEVPELTIDKAIDRNWVRREDGRLMEAKPPMFLHTSPLWSPAISNWFYSSRRFDSHWWGQV